MNEFLDTIAHFNLSELEIAMLHLKKKISDKKEQKRKVKEFMETYKHKPMTHPLYLTNSECESLNNGKGKIENFKFVEQEDFDDEAGEREFMRAESRNRELSEDELLFV